MYERYAGAKTIDLETAYILKAIEQVTGLKITEELWKRYPDLQPLKKQKPMLAHRMTQHEAIKAVLRAGKIAVDCYFGYDTALEIEPAPAETTRNRTKKAQSANFGQSV